MEFKNYLYIASLLLLLVVIIVYSMFRRFEMWKNIKYMVPAVIISTALFIMMGSRFVEFNIWQFDPNSNIKIYLMNLPIEEWLKYLILSFFGFLVFETVENYYSHFIKDNFFVVVSLILLTVFAVIAYFNRQLIYTFMVFMFAAIYLGYTVFRNKFKSNYSSFYTSFVFLLVPFYFLSLISAGIPFIEYNHEYILEFYIFSTPIENLAGFFLMFLMNITIYKYLSERRFF